MLDFIQIEALGRDPLLHRLSSIPTAASFWRRGLRPPILVHKLECNRPVQRNNFHLQDGDEFDTLFH